MRITYKGDYALKAVLDLALHYGSQLVTLQDMSRRLDIPVKFLEQIVLDLKRGGFLASKRGKVGGYLLAKHPAQITLGELIRFIDGPVEPIACVKDSYTGCRELKRCIFRPIWQKLSSLTSSVIDDISLQDLVKKVKQADAFSYQI